MQVTHNSVVQIREKLACTAGAPVCFFVSYHAEPTSTERNLSASPARAKPSLRTAEKQLFLLDSPAKKAKRAPAMPARESETWPSYDATCVRLELTHLYAQLHVQSKTHYR